MSINLGSAIAYMDIDSSRFTAGLSRVTSDLRNFTDRTNDTGSRLTSLGSAMKTVGGSMTKAFTLPLAAAGAAAVKTSMDTEESMAKVNSILQLSSKEFTSYETTLKKGANEMGLAYNKYADAAYDAISAGVQQADVTAFLSDANKLAKGGLTDLASATNLLTTVQNAYNLSQEDMVHVSDVLITTQNLGKVTVDELAASMGKIIPTANSLGVNVEQLGAGYAILTAKGIASAEATTYMNAMFNELGKTGTGVDKALRKISGQSFKELSESGKSTGDILGMLSEYAEQSGLSLSDLFGSSEAAKAAVTLLSNGVEGFNEKLVAMKDSTDATNKAFNEMNNTTKEKLNQSFDALKNSLADVGKAIEPLVDKIAELITGFSQWLSEISQNNPALVQVGVVILGIVAAIGPLLIALGSFIGLLGFAATGLMTLTGATTAWAAVMAVVNAPITLVIAAITALVAIGVVLYKNWDEIKAKASEVWEQLVTSFETWVSNMKQSIEEKWNQIKTFLSDTWDGIVQLGTNIWEGFKNYMSELWNSIVENCTNAWNAVGTFFMETVPNWISNVITWFKELPYNIGFALGEVIGHIYSWGTEAWSYLETNVPMWIDSVVTYFSELPGRMAEYLSEAIQKIIDWGTETWENVKTTGENVVTSVKEWASTVPVELWNGLLEAIQKVKDWGTNTYESAVNTGSQFLKALQEWLSQVPGKVHDWLTQAVNKAIEWATEMGRKATEGATIFVTNMVTGLKEAPGKVVSVGSDIVKGIWNGILGAKDWLMNKISSFASGIVDGFKSALGIHSPSRVAADEIGQHLPPGIGVGVQRSMPKLLKTIEDSSKAIVDEYKEGMEPMTDVVKTMWTKNESYWKDGSSKVEKAEKDHAAKMKSITDKKNNSILEAKKKYANNKKKLQDAIKKADDTYARDKKKADEAYAKTTGKTYEDRLKLERDYTNNMSKIQEEYQGKISDLTNKFKADQEKLNEEYAKILEKRVDTLMNWTNIFAEVKRDEEAASSWELINNLQDQVNVFEKWADNMAQLKGKIGDALYSELLAQGPQAFQEIEAINNMTEGQLKRYEELYETKRKLAEAQAKIDTQADRDRINTEMENLKKTYDEKFLELTTKMTEEVSKQINTVKDKFGTVPPAMLNMGKDSISKFIEGINSMRNSLYSAIDELVSTANSRLSTINVEAKVERSISPFFMDDTRSVARGMAFEVARSNNTAKTVSAKKAQPEEEKLPKDKPKDKPNVNIYNTYNSPKPASISELKRQDELQARRLAMQLNI